MAALTKIESAAAIDVFRAFDRAVEHVIELNIRAQEEPHFAGGHAKCAMNIVIQCAARKRRNAGCLTDDDGARIVFVGDPQAAPSRPGVRYARPDDEADDGETWREYLWAYNKSYNESGGNPCNLVPAYTLYDVPVYGALVERYGADHVFILSAGWGLVNAAFLLPQYDITFSSNADAWKRRSQRDHYDDFCLLPLDCDDELVFFGGKDYQPLFSRLSRRYRGKRVVFYNSSAVPEMPGCRLIRYPNPTKGSMNWHYSCAEDFMAGSIDCRTT